MNPRRRDSCTARFVLVVASGLCYFTALAMLTPVLPDYVEKSLGAGSVAVGIAVGAFAVGAVPLRTYAGKFGDTVGRRVLIIGGALIVGASTACYGLVHALWFLVLLRVVTGFGEAGFFVGAATMITDLSPAHRRGEAVSYWSVAVYGGLSFGPVLGSVLHGSVRHGGGRYGLVWAVSARSRPRGRARRVHRGGRAHDHRAALDAPLAPRRGRAGHRVVPRHDPAGGLHRVRAALRALAPRERGRHLRALRRAHPRRAHRRRASCPTGWAAPRPPRSRSSSWLPVSA